jgi:TonB-dependent starch-binding outer membrane protein SusC
MHLTAYGKAWFRRFRKQDLLITHQTLLVMKMTAFLLFIVCMHVAAKTQAQISLSEKKAPLEKVLKEIKKQSGYALFYDAALLQKAHPVDIEVKDVSLDQALGIIFKDQPLTFEIVGDKIITIKDKSESSKSSGMISPPVDVHGRVTDSLGNPLQGASVTVKGTRKGIQTDAGGNFTLKGVADNATIIISIVGYENQQIELKGEKELFITLKLGITSLQDVVVSKGYYNTTERLNTGDVTKVTSDEIEKQPVPDPILALEGRVPGLSIMQTSGVPGAGSTIMLRGQNSIANGNAPFYIVDGVPFSSTSITSNYVGGIFGTPAEGGQFGISPFNALNPSDIESIEVLKDADATAIYGSQGANGVILITTKKGKAGKTTVNVNIYTGTGKVTRMLDMLNTQQYLEMRHEALNNDAVAPSISNGDYDLLFWDTTRYTNWQKVLIGNPAPFTNAQVSLSGGDINTQFLISGDYSTQGTVFPGAYKDQKASGHFSLTHSSPDHRFHAQFNAEYINDNSNLPQTDFTSQITLAPDAPALYDASGNVNWQPLNGTATFYNPLRYTGQSAKAVTDNLISSLNLSYQILQGLQLKSSFGYNHDQMNQNLLSSSSYVPPPYNLNPSYKSNNFGTTELNSWVIEPQLNFSRLVGKGHLDILAGTTFRENTKNDIGFNASGFSSDALISDPSAASSLSLDGSTNSLYHYTALFGRVGYNWEEKYLLNLTARRDGSSRFGPEKQFGNFGSVGAGWIFSKEKFIESDLPFLSFGKLRGSYGITGNDQIGDYQFLSTYTPNSLTYQGITGLRPTSLTNPYFAWETNKKLEGGLDLGFFKDRILLSGSYYTNRSSNQLVGYPLPIVTGFGSIQENLPATVENTGLEFTFNTVNFKSKNFTWASSANVSIPQNKLISYPGIENSGFSYTYAVGHSLFSKYVYHSIGVDPQTGIYTFASKAGNGVPSYPSDLVLSKPVTQSYYGGINNSFSFKGFHLDIFIQFVKQLGYNYLYYSAIAGISNNNEPTTVLSRWQNSGDITNIQKFTTSYYPVGAAFYNYWLPSDAAITDASFIRFKNLAFSYDLPNAWLNKAHLQQTKVYLQCQNLFTITGYKGLDPETGGMNLPPLRMLTVGLKMTL